jgi:Zn-dependent alcohol dehydrogenase
MLTKTILKKQLESFPENFSIDDLIERLVVIEKIEKANQQSKNGEVISEEKFEQETASWFK